MIELPESHVLADQIKQMFEGKTVTQVVAGQSPHKFAWYHGDPAGYDGLLQGHALTNAWANGGQVEIAFENLRLSLNDGVNPRYIAPGEQTPAKHQLLIEFDDGSALCCTVQMYGGMMAFPAGTNENPYYLVGKQKPTPYTDAFDLAYFQGLFAEVKPQTSIKALLATEQRIPGLGNGVLQDILFRAGIHPRTPVSALGESERSGLYTVLKTTLADMRSAGGRNTEKDLYGKPGGYACLLCAKTLPFPCPRCGGVLARKAYLGGNIYYCASCQPLETPK